MNRSDTSGPRHRFTLVGLLMVWIPASAQTYTFTTLAGTPSAGYADGTGSAARFGSPQDVAVDGNGNVYIADTGNFVIRKMMPEGTVTTLAGQPGQRGSDDGMGSSARFIHPRSIAVDGTGNVYLADNNTIRKVSPHGLVTTLAGSTGESGSTDGTGARRDSAIISTSRSTRAALFMWRTE